MPIGERKRFLKELCLQESGLDKIVREGHDLLHLITFFTVGPKEVHAWTVRKGATAPEAAGVIHTDFEKGFIHAEIIRCDEFVRVGSKQAMKDSLLIRIEERKCLVEEGTFVYFRFNV